MDMDYIITKNKSTTNLSGYLHSITFSPRITTFTKAIKNNVFVIWSGIDNVKYTTLLGKTTATGLGHLVQKRLNL